MTEVIATGVRAIGGLLIVIVFLMAASAAVSWYGSKLFSELTRVYHLRVIGYWLNRLEKVGVREFEKAECEDLSIKRMGNKP